MHGMSHCSDINICFRWQRHGATTALLSLYFPVLSRGWWKCPFQGNPCPAEALTQLAALLLF